MITLTNWKEKRRSVLLLRNLNLRSLYSLTGIQLGSFLLMTTVRMYISICNTSLHSLAYSTSVVSIGFAEPAYTALEDGGSVQVCLELCEGSLNRPVDVLLYTDEGSAFGEN